MRYTFVSDGDVPDLGIKAGDVVVVVPGAPVPVSVHRRLPSNYGALLRACEDGRLRLTDATAPLHSLARVVGAAAPPRAPADHPPSPLSLVR